MGMVRMFVCLHEHVEDWCHFLHAMPATFYVNLGRISLEEGTSIEKNSPNTFAFQQVPLGWCSWMLLKSKLSKP